MQSLKETRNAASSAQCAHDNKVGWRGGERLHRHAMSAPHLRIGCSLPTRSGTPRPVHNEHMIKKKVRLEGRRTPPLSHDERTSPADRLVGTPPLKRQNNVGVHCLGNANLGKPMNWGGSKVKEQGRKRLSGLYSGEMCVSGKLGQCYCDEEVR
ncbi:hypothetical protein NDU88_005899 [Pleurodeles waltl]|uniref:Uncharacterized protein n=1 Tax=Pleurodeles waltl TaxID=8319 RepID=A0AAV7WZL9_PLEWA|nr:hypothetical protein NDU88_005899 [Pleurodeles waltl]